MKERSWGDILGDIIVKIAMLLVKALALIGWLVLTALVSILKDVTSALKNFLFGKKD